MKRISKAQILKALNKIDPNCQQVIYQSVIRIAQAQLDSCEEEFSVLQIEKQMLEEELIDRKKEHKEKVREILDKIEQANAVRPYPHSGIVIEEPRWQALKKEVNDDRIVKTIEEWKK